jgi:sugar transferase (PEP-CTERM system associated)
MLIGGDFLFAAANVYAAAMLTGWWQADLEGRYPFDVVALFFGLATLGALYFQDLYALERRRSCIRLVRDVMTGEAGLALVMPFLLLAVPGLNFGRRFYVAYFALAGPGLMLWRLAVNESFFKRLSIGVAILGIGEEAALLANEIRKREHVGYKFLGFVKSRVQRESMLVGGSYRGSAQAATSLSGLPSIEDLRTLVVTSYENSSFTPRELLGLKFRGVEVIGFESFYERLTGRLPAEMLSERWLVFAPGFDQSRLNGFAKRIADLVVAVAIGLITLPVALIMALAIKLDSHGPVLYSQDRVGLDGRIFRLYKFRSMHDGAESATGAVYARHDDPRVTRVGGFMRKLRLDEIPQLFNVLRGDMSLVGPRPERPEFVGDFRNTLPFYDYRHSVRPGITGWAQVCYPYGAGVSDANEKLCYDLYYIKNHSVMFDLQIMFQTVKVVLFGRGAR